MDYERNQLGQVTALYYPDTTSKSGMQIDFSYTSLGKVDTITRSPDTLVDYDYAGSNVLSRSYPDPTNDVHYTLAYDSFGRVTRHHTYQDGPPDVEIADFNYTYDDNGNILSQEFAHRTSTPDNIYTYDDLDRLTEADYLVGVLTEDEQFTYDLLGNRLNLNNRAGSDVVYTHNIANEYATIGGQTVSHDAAGNLSVDANGYKYFYDYENRLETIKNSSNVVKAEYTYDALGRRIEKYDVAAGTRTRYYYDGWRVLSETNAAGTVQREYVYGNYLDEVLVMVDSSDDDHYYAHNHLFSPVALLADDGTVEERYEYDAYGKVTVITDKGTGTWWDGDETTASVSAQGNPYYFTGQRLDALDNNSLLVMYYKNRYYDTDTGRFLQRDPLGVRDEIGLVIFTSTGTPRIHGIFNSRRQYREGNNLYEYAKNNSLMHKDIYGLCKDKCSSGTAKILDTEVSIEPMGHPQGGIDTGLLKDFIDEHSPLPVDGLGGAIEQATKALVMAGFGYHVDITVIYDCCIKKKPCFLTKVLPLGFTFLRVARGAKCWYWDWDDEDHTRGGRVKDPDFRSAHDPYLFGPNSNKGGAPSDQLLKDAVKDLVEQANEDCNSRLKTGKRVKKHFKHPNYIPRER